MEVDLRLCIWLNMFRIEIFSHCAMVEWCVMSHEWSTSMSQEYGERSVRLMGDSHTHPHQHSVTSQLSKTC